MIAQAPLRGPGYSADNQRVYWIIQDIVSGTDGWAWIKDVQTEDGQLAITKLHEHYDGPGAKTRRVQDAKERLKVCHYKNEQVFTFEKFITTLKDCFDTMEDDECPVTERDKIDYLLDGIQCPALSAAVSTISMNPNLRENFVNAANTLSRDSHHQEGQEGREPSHRLTSSKMKMND